MKTVAHNKKPRTKKIEKYGTFTQPGWEGKRFLVGLFADLNKLEVGETVTHYYGAPGTGKTTYRMLEKAETWLLVELVADTSRVMSPSEVE